LARFWLHSTTRSDASLFSPVPGPIACKIETIKLLDYRARQYDPYLNRFISPDSIVPDPANPQSLNRFAYALNSPVRYIDPSGHKVRPPNMPGSYAEYETAEWGPLGTLYRGLCVLVGGVTGTCHCEKETETVPAVNPLGNLTTVQKSVSWKVIWNDQEYYVRTAYRYLPMTMEWIYVPELAPGVSAWELGPFSRGRQIHEALGENLPGNYPTIDIFDDGVATSIKSLDLKAKTYQNTNRLERTVQGYVNKLANWQGARWAGVNIQSVDIAQRQLLLAIPPGATEAQVTALQGLQNWAAEIGVTITIVVVP
jgi:RHS repeat-associated protein